MRSQREKALTSGGKPAEPFEFGFREVLRILKRNWGVITLCVVFAFAVGTGYLWITPPQYTATALLLIDSRSNVLPSSQMRATDANGESAYVETQVGILRSDRIARLVVSEQRLHQRPEFQEESGLLAQSARVARSVLSKFWLHGIRGFEEESGLLARAATEGSARVDEPTDAPLSLESVPPQAVKEFGRRTGIRRSQSTYIIDISFTHQDSKLAADIANAIAQAYLNDRLSAREEAIRKASAWLQHRAVDLRRETQAAETALDEFRNGNAAMGSSRSVLRELESTAQTYRRISESFHKQFLETSQEQYFSPLDARILSEAWLPAEKSQPRGSLVLASAAGSGLAFGFLIALLRGDGQQPPRGDRQGRRARGVVPVTATRFAASDQALFPEVERIMRENHKNAHAAALDLAAAGKISGGGSESSRARRLAARFERHRAALVSSG